MKQIWNKFKTKKDERALHAQWKEHSLACELLLDVKGDMKCCECMLMKWLTAGAVCNDVDHLTERKRVETLYLVYVALGDTIIFILNFAVRFQWTSCKLDFIAPPSMGWSEPNHMHFRFLGQLERATSCFGLA